MAKNTEEKQYTVQEILNRVVDEDNWTLSTSEGSFAVYSADSFQATINSANASSATQVKVGSANKSIYVTDLIITVGTAMSVKLQDSAGSPAILVQALYLPANSVFSKQFKTPIKVATGNDLNVLASTSGNISVFVSGYVL